MITEESIELRPVPDDLTTRPVSDRLQQAERGLPGLVRGWPHRHVDMSARGPLRHAKDPSRRVQRPGVEPFNLHRPRRSRPNAKRLRPPPLHPQGRRGRGEAALGDGLADTRFCRRRTYELTVTGGRWFLSVCYRKAKQCDKAAARCNIR